MKKKVLKETKSNEEIRTMILRHLYEVHSTQKSMGKMAQGIRDLRKALKVKHNLSQQQVAHNLDYLVQVGWVAVDVTERVVLTNNRRQIPSSSRKYKISDVGIRHLEEAQTLFARTDSKAAVNITNLQGVTIVGEGNLVHSSHIGTSNALDVLSGAISAASELEERQKLDSLAEIGTIRSQLAKTEPDKTIVSAAWEALEKLSTIASLAQTVTAAKVFVEGLLVGK